MSEGWFERERREAEEDDRRSLWDDGKLKRTELSARARRDLERQTMLYEDAVREFHEKLGFAVGQPMRTDYMPRLAEMAETLLAFSLELEQRVGDEDGRWVRAHLLLEELGETLLAMSFSLELRTFDGLCDLLYVVVGAAVAFGLPLDAGFWEVHRSNMTKKRREGDAGRCRDKGDEFSPPDLARVLAER